MIIQDIERNEKIFFIGMGGISMSALAQFLCVNGYSVAGFDDNEGENLIELKKNGVPVFVKKLNEKVYAELESASIVVYTDAISPEHALYIKAKEKGLTMFSRAEFLGRICLQFPYSIGIAGSHGKTTCTAMTARGLKALNAKFTAHIGGIDAVLGNFYANGEEFFVTECCEYKRNLLKIPCEVAVVLNIDLDHMECYANEKQLTDVFRKFCHKAKRAFVCADDENCLSLGDFVTFGIKNQFSDYRAVNLKEIGQCYHFTVQEYGKELCKIRLKAKGICNVYNALAAFAVIRSYGFDEREIVKGIEEFSGVKRRFEEIGIFNGATCICDYAHHPKEIASTIQTATELYKRLFVVFQPHTYSRTKLLMKDFVEVLRKIENLVIYKTYPAREFYDESGSAKTLAENVGGCLYIENMRELKCWLKRNVHADDAVLFLGAGDIYYIVERIVER